MRSGLASLDITGLLPFQGRYSGIQTLGDLIGRRGGGGPNGQVPEDPWIPWDEYPVNRIQRGMEHGRPSQHHGLPPINTFPQLRSPDVEQFFQNPPWLPGDLSMGDWTPVETWPQDVMQFFEAQDYGPSFEELLQNLFNFQ